LASGIGGQRSARRTAKRPLTRFERRLEFEFPAGVGDMAAVPEDGAAVRTPEETLLTDQDIRMNLPFRGFLIGQ
jgi:hypothetical protein